MKEVWDTYRSRMDVRGNTRRETALNREKRYLKSKVPDSLDYDTVIVDGVEMKLAVIDSDNLDMKTVCTLPDETIRYGAMIDWGGYHWILVEKDARSEVRTKGVMRQCNYLLRFVGYDGSIQERWCYIEDGTKLEDSFRVVRAA